LLSSLLEEIGELATALRVEEKVIDHKTLDEDSLGECCDVFVCGMMMYFVTGGATDELCLKHTQIEYFGEQTKENPTTDPFEVLSILALETTTGAGLFVFGDEEETKNWFLKVANRAAGFYSQRGGKDMLEAVNKKLDKWESRYKKEAQ
jgi:hypothetical protein